MSTYRSWGYTPPIKQTAVRPGWKDIQLKTNGSTWLPYGNGRSYGDSCLNSGGKLIDCRSLNKFIAFDTKSGILRCEAGLTFNEILETIIPAGWFLPVTPGTKYVTMGGAVANDVHGKNHHQDGTIGRHIQSFELVRSTGERFVCSPAENEDLFKATIGGLGLTGLITWVEIQLIPVHSSYLDVETIPFQGLQEFLTLSDESNAGYQYIVAWLDCVVSGKNFTRGLFMRANHQSTENNAKSSPKKSGHLTVPINFPKWSINRHSISAFNFCYYHANTRKSGKSNAQHYDSFFYPLDSIDHWNRIYGNQGFYQYQFVVPLSETEIMEEILNKIVSSGLGSFLAVLKEFGDISSPGMLSFPRPGICLALDFSNRGALTLNVLQELDELVIKVGGAVYPAKDLRMSGKAFKAFFPQLDQFSDFIDPNFNSDFWQRVNA